MRAAKQAAHNVKLLQDLVPLNALSQERFGEIAERIVIEVVRPDASCSVRANATTALSISSRVNSTSSTKMARRWVKS